MRQGIRTALALLRLYRADAAVISLMSYCLGLLLVDRLTAGSVLPGLWLSLVTFNFIYSINDWADVRSDALNRPRRPLPAGDVGHRAALRYCLALLAIALVYPFFVFDDRSGVAAALGLVVLGALYSVPPLRLKRFALTSPFVITLMYVTPMTIGLLRHEDPLGGGRWGVVLFFAVYCLSVIPLKDITDVKGDAADGCQNWMTLLGRRRLLAVSALGLLAAVVVSALCVRTPLGWALGFLGCTTLAVVVLATRSERLLARLYRTILLLVVVEGATLLSVWYLWFR
jgi:4-hydroxybenzoate polyprenyltransferase